MDALQTANKRPAGCAPAVPDLVQILALKSAAMDTTYTLLKLVNQVADATMPTKETTTVAVPVVSLRTVGTVN